MTSDKNNYYYHSALPVAEQLHDLAPADIEQRLGGVFTIGSLLGRGAFGEVYSLSETSPDPQEAQKRFVLKVSNQDVFLPPYLLRKPVSGRFLYILSHGKEEEFWQKCQDTLRYLGQYLHVKQRRAHGDVSPGNLLLTRHSWTENLRRLVKLLGWKRVCNFSPVVFDLIDPDIAGPFGRPKAISHIMHEDPRCDRWGPLDDLIGLLNTILLWSGVTVERIGEYCFDQSCDYKYSCDERAARDVWQLMLIVYSTEDDYDPKAIKSVLQNLRDADRSQSCLMSAVVPHGSAV
eukprot:TRINITY_DN2067_c0_g1_i3.p1 TRINITY_DN2067_c0_g1~~TRINITY_DN2067_c0_g1_i3.p1  ORF type:complete len:290 (-),score=1.82 TRINITY_DN2067_c0_g1_i3:111-980(-)